jgi:hypothetical protein
MDPEAPQGPPSRLTITHQLAAAPDAARNVAVRDRRYIAPKELSWCSMISGTGVIPEAAALPAEHIFH